MSTSRCESVKELIKKQSLMFKLSPVKRNYPLTHNIGTLSPTPSDNYSFLSNPHTFLIRNPYSFQREKSIEYSQILHSGSMKDLYREQYKKDLEENRRTTSRNTSSNKARTIFSKVDTYTKELKNSITNLKGKKIIVPQFTSVSHRNRINPNNTSSFPFDSSTIKNITITRNKKNENTLKWSMNNTINIKPVKKPMYTVTSIEMKNNLKTSASSMSSLKRNSNY